MKQHEIAGLILVFLDPLPFPVFYWNSGLACVQGNRGPGAPSTEWLAKFRPPSDRRITRLQAQRKAGLRRRLPVHPPGLRAQGALCSPSPTWPAPRMCAIRTSDFSGCTSQKVGARAHSPLRTGSCSNAVHQRSLPPDQRWSDPTFLSCSLVGACQAQRPNMMVEKPKPLTRGAAPPAGK